MIVLDSSFIIAYHNTRDVHHAASSPVMEQIISGKWGRPLLLEYVFLEVVTVLLARRGLAVAGNVASILLQAHEIDFVPCSDLFLNSYETFRSQGNARLSFTDAAIVTLARRQNVGLVASFDSDFKHIDGVRVVPANKK
jgi:predicted nucleic acid-binding protein